VTDGNREGTFLVEDLYVRHPKANSVDANPIAMHLFQDELLFLARNPVYASLNGREVYAVNNFFNPNLTGTVYNDLNGNNQMDNNEAGVPGIPVTLLPTGQVTFTNASGIYGFDVKDRSRQHSVKVESERCWSVDQSEVIVPPINTVAYKSDFIANIGMTSLEDENYKFTVDFTTSRPICNTFGKHWITIINESCFANSGKIDLKIDHRDTLVLADVPYDSLTGTYSFKFDNLDKYNFYSNEMTIKRANETIGIPSKEFLVVLMTLMINW